MKEIQRRPVIVSPIRLRRGAAVLTALLISVMCAGFLSQTSSLARAESESATVAAAPAANLTITQVLSKAYIARGGLTRIRAVQGQRVTGTISFGNDALGPFFVELKRPQKMHMELTIQNQTMIRIYDGKEGWSNNPFAGKTNLEPMNEDDLKNIADEADFDGALVDYRKKGNQVELVGKDKVEDKDVWRVKLTAKSGDVRYYLFDAASFLLLKWEGKRLNEGKEVPIHSYFRDYREAGGLKFAFQIDSGNSANDLTQRIIIDKIDLNPQIPDAQFEKPGTPGAWLGAPALLGSRGGDIS
jgi:outer membrane lipoprotein-sorting protein